MVALALRLSELPAGAALPASLLAWAFGLFLWRRERLRPPRTLLWPGDGGPARVDGQPVQALRVEWQGPLVRVSWRGERWRRPGLLFWPDTLPPARRRELRLAVSNAGIPPSRPAMAP